MMISKINLINFAHKNLDGFLLIEIEPYLHGRNLNKIMSCKILIFFIVIYHNDTSLIYSQPNLKFYI